MGDLGNPHYNVAEALTFDVEMEGRTGHTCHVYVMADTAQDAEEVASRQFPELRITENTQDVT